MNLRQNLKNGSKRDEERSLKFYVSVRRKDGSFYKKTNLLLVQSSGSRSPSELNAKQQKILIWDNCGLV